jgi:hypothetical protein
MTKQIARAKWLLAHTKSYEEWVRTASRSNLEATENEFGSARAFYDKFVGELKRIIEDPKRWLYGR